MRKWPGADSLILDKLRAPASLYACDGCVWSCTWAAPPDGRPPKKGQGYTIRHVRISDAALAAPPRKTSDVTREAPPHPDGMRAEEVAVRGFLRRQVCGKGNADRKVIFVAPFTRTQWVSAEREVRVR